MPHVLPLAVLTAVLFAAPVGAVAQTAQQAAPDPLAEPSITGSPAPGGSSGTPEEPLPIPSDETDAGEVPEDDMSLGEIPLVETVELSAEQTKRAIDAYGLVREKYAEAGLENYEDLQEFVDKTDAGKAFEVDIKAAGFGSVNEWNLVVTTASFAYSNVIDDQTEDIELQIEEIKQNTELAQDMKDRMVKSLQAMIPTANNRQVIESLMKDPAYVEKMKYLAVEEE